jgi:hypothetical protein
MTNSAPKTRWAPLAIFVLAVAASAAGGWWLLHHKTTASPASNSIFVIAPYWYNGTWVFDDAAAGLKREPFVGGVPEMMNVLVKDIPDARDGFRLTFSAQPFPGHQYKLAWLRGDTTGNWYKLDEPAMEGWICPAMFRYYSEAPKSLYVKADPVAK